MRSNPLAKHSVAGAALAPHCAALAKDYKAAAKQNLELAAIHRQLAKDIAK